MVRRILRATLLSLASLAAFVMLYLLCAYCLPKITVNGDIVPEGDIDVYVTTNGVHTDFVVPLRNAVQDWGTVVQFAHTRSKDSSATFVSFGWGDKGFYLQTPTWAELKFSVAFKAAFALSSSAMHITFRTKPEEGDSCIKLRLSETQYRALVTYIASSFQYTSDRQSINIVTNAQYGANDAFYEANGRYNLFFTCNTWTNCGLKACGQRACLWTPFESGIFYQYRH